MYVNVSPLAPTRNCSISTSFLTSNADKSVPPPKPIPGKTWAMLGSGSEPNVANCAKSFPSHPITESDGQRKGLHYKGAAGSRIPNKGECSIVHVEPDGTKYDFTFQHADVHSIILSVSMLVVKDCSVTFTKHGGHILYPDGRKIRVIAKQGVFYVLLNVLPPGTRDVIVLTAPCWFEPADFRVVANQSLKTFAIAVAVVGNVRRDDIRQSLCLFRQSINHRIHRQPSRSRQSFRTSPHQRVNAKRIIPGKSPMNQQNFLNAKLRMQMLKIETLHRVAVKLQNNRCCCRLSRIRLVPKTIFSRHYQLPDHPNRAHQFVPDANY